MRDGLLLHSAPHHVVAATVTDIGAPTAAHMSVGHRSHHAGRSAGGHAFRISMRWDTGAKPPASSVAGEPLHWRTAGDSLVAIAAAPIDSAQGVTLTLTCDGQPPRTLRLTTDAGTYRLEALRVAPAFPRNQIRRWPHGRPGKLNVPRPCRAPHMTCPDCGRSHSWCRARRASPAALAVAAPSTEL